MVRCGWASIDERGRVSGGKAGDQTGREVKLGNWYNFNQSMCLRWKSRKKAKKYAKVIRQLCESHLVGYDQSERITLYNALKNCRWNVSKFLKKGVAVECDCSMLVACAINVVMKKALISSGIYTGNLEDLLMRTRLFKKYTGYKYCDVYEYLMTGDILNAPCHHVISVLSDGSKADVKKDTSKPDVPLPTLQRGSTGSEVKKLQCILNTLGCEDKSNKKLKTDGVFGTSTYEAVCTFQKRVGITVDGIYGSKTSELLKRTY